MKALVQHFPGEEQLEHVSVEQLMAILRQIEGERGSTIEVRRDEGEYPRLIVAVDQGRFTATALMNDEFYDRVGDADAVGVTELVIGGQLVEGLPARFVLNPEQAREVLKEFISTDQWTVSAGWISQGSADWH